MTNPTPQTASDREAAFRRDLAELLAKHGAQMEATDETHKTWPNLIYPAISVVMNAQWSGDRLVMEYVDFLL